MGPNSKATFTIAGEDHSAQIMSTTDDEVVLTVQSEPQQVTIDKDASEEVDLNGDGFNDVKITYNGVDNSGRADLTFVGLEQPAPGQERPVEEPVEEPVAPEGGNSTLVIIIIVIIVIVIVGYFMMRRKN